MLLVSGPLRSADLASTLPTVTLDTPSALAMA